MQCNGGDDRLSSIEHVPATRFASVQRKWLKPRDACDRKNNLIVHSNWLTGQELSNPSILFPYNLHIILIAFIQITIRFFFVEIWMFNETSCFLLTWITRFSKN